MRLAVVALAVYGCGRVGFDATGSAAIDAPKPAVDAPLLALDAGQCPPAYERHGTRCYRYAAMSTSWLAAEFACEADCVGAHLAVLDDANEADLVDNVYSQDVWLGATDRVVEGDYREVTGASMRSREWDIGEPNGGAEDCMALDSTAIPELRDWPCSNLFDSLCEYDAMPVQPSTY